ncbi:MAG: FHA domain-containing protein, partial [Acidimicrobiales bacterium]
GEHRGQEFELGEELTLGRAAGCQVRLDDTFVSQLHARIFRRDDHFWVEDLGSSNGTYLNRRGTQSRDKVSGPVALGRGDRLLVGKSVLEVIR